MAPVAARLAELLGRPVATAADCVGPAVAAAAAALAPGDVLLLENLRFDAGETANDPALRRARWPASPTSTSTTPSAPRTARTPRPRASPTCLPAVAGLLLTREVEVLGRAARATRRARSSSSSAAPRSPTRSASSSASSSARRRDPDRRRDVLHLLQGAGPRDRPLAGRGRAGSTRPPTRSPLRDARRRELLLPVDLVVAPSPDAGADGARPWPSTASAATTWASTSARGPPPPSRAGSRGAGTVFWNGPMGALRARRLRRRHRAVAEAVAASRAVTVVGGGDSVAAVRALRPRGPRHARLDRRRRVAGAARGQAPCPAWRRCWTVSAMPDQTGRRGGR